MCVCPYTAKSIHNSGTLCPTLFITNTILLTSGGSPFLEKKKPRPNSSIYECVDLKFDATYESLQESSLIKGLVQSSDESGLMQFDLKDDVFVQISSAGKINMYYRTHEDKIEAEKILRKLVVCDDIKLLKDIPRNLGYTFEQFERIAKQEAVESRRQEELENMLKDHYEQLVDEVYMRWFDIPSSVNISPEFCAKYEILRAKVACGDRFLYDGGDIIAVELKEPSHQNQRIADEAVSHLRCYSEAWKFWSDAKTEVEKNLAEVKGLWCDLKDLLKNSLANAEKLKALTEWHGYGPRPDEYYSLRNTFSFLWLCVQDNRFLSEMNVRQEGRYYIVRDLAQSLRREAMEDFIQTIRDLVQKRKFKRKQKLP